MEKYETWLHSLGKNSQNMFIYLFLFQDFNVNSNQSNKSFFEQ